ncbi:MAG: response regulator transcription factor [Acidimicrobiia bacterium]
MIRMILVEDQSMVRDAFAELLGMEPDFEVVATASNGEKALDMVRTMNPDLVLTDIEMPVMTGLDLAAAVKAIDEPPRVVIVTTFSRQGYLRRALELGVAGYVLKDSPIAELVDALRTVAAGGTVIAPELAVAAWGSGDPLTDRERDVLRLVGDGRPNAEIAEALFLAEGTVRNYLSAAITKLGARNRTEAHAMARERGLL